MALTRLGNIANTLPDNSIFNSKLSNIVNFKNIIINGDMSIAQRATSASGLTTNGYYTVDRWTLRNFQGGTYTMAQTPLTSSDTPFSYGFSQSVKYDCTSTSSTERLVIHRQNIEGQNLQYLRYGTSNAKSLTISFWVKSNVTGTATINLYLPDSNKQQVQTYTIDTANTWEKKSVIFSGNTSDIIDNNSGSGMLVSFNMSTSTEYTSGTQPTTWTTYSNPDWAVGQTIDISANTSNEISFTGIQLEVGTTASDFEFLPYDMNLQRCQRYFKIMIWAYAPTIRYTAGAGTGKAQNWITLSPEMRATPSFTANNFTATTGYTGALVVVSIDKAYLSTRATNASDTNVCLYANGSANLDAEL